MISANCEKFLRQALRNEEFVCFLSKNCKKKEFFNWVFVVIYYCALHYFNALLDNKGIKLPQSHKTYDNHDGDVDLAGIHLYTNKNNIIDSVADDYKNLFQWSQDVRYRSEVLGESELKIAINVLMGIKLITFNEIGYRPEREKNVIQLIKSDEMYLNSLNNKRKEFQS